ncbi:Reticulon-4 receptor 2 [Schistosoma japonicum]|nr:Reticulon-4 receptor 2 [Schistosoma japonicum]KAH8876638.1 Reticulon-4 receptor 2 [Schistosoma japonicum]KAH8876639.1 Reticulon-4 receptor 2 [Schistosoma japonicum]
MDYLQILLRKSHKLHHNIHCILLIVITVCTIKLSYGIESTLCPQQCICSSKRMNCELPGLKYLPIPPMLQLEYLLIQNQTFLNTHLGSNELSIYRSIEYGGKIQLKSLHIRYCNIASLGRNTFQALGSQLRLLDLTGNPLIDIADYAFTGLDQLTLIMDEIKLTNFHENTFNGLTKMKSLIMRNSNLRELPYKSLEQLTSISRLNQLILKGNQLQRLNIKYDVIFKELQNFEINDNPWHCDCQLNWLIKRYRHIHKNDWNDTIENSWDREDNQPKCSTPHSLAGYKFSDLITDLSEAYHPITTNTWGKLNPPFILYCPPPQLERLDVDLTKLHYSDSKISQNTVREKRNERLNLKSTDQHSSVRLTCSMKGSTELSIMWYYHKSDMTVLNLSNIHVTRKYSDDRQLSRLNKENEAWSIRSNEIIRAESELEVTKQHEVDMYSCVGIDVIGNVTATVRLQWPLIMPTKLLEMENEPLTALTLPYNESKPTYLNSWPTTPLSQSGSVLHTKQFSLGELIAATAGTFLSTVLLFFIIYQSLHRRLSPCDKRKQYRPHKTDNAILEVPGISPGGTSSSNTSCSASRPAITTSSIETNVSETSITNCPTGQMNSESISLATNLLNAQQFLNGMSAFTHTTLPVNMRQQTMQTELGRCIRPAQSSTIGDGSLNSMSYEPISYSDANNVTYDVPWIVNTNSNNLNNGNVVNVNQRISNEHCIPLLYNGLPTSITNPIESNHSTSHLHGGLFIPPPPSIPQPSLPNSCTNSTLSLKNVTVQPNFQGNLLFLQSGCYPPTMNSVTSNSQFSQGSTGLTNYLNYHS